MKEKSTRNKTLHPSNEDLSFFTHSSIHSEDLGNLYLGSWQCLPLVPNSVDLLIADPPYNMNKSFKDFSFKKQSDETYEAYTDEWLSGLLPYLKKDASIYICCDWKSSSVIYRVLSQYVSVLNRITWEREKGRSSISNWKNASEDIWFAVNSKAHYFNAEAVKIKKRVLAPYRENGEAKDWKKEGEESVRLTGASNFWNDITVPYWSMPENTPHPTQKPEKLLAKLILASSKKGDLILDPFCGSGSTLVVAKKLERRFLGSEIDPYYAALSRKRLFLAESNKRIQGYEDGVFKERNMK